MNSLAAKEKACAIRTDIIEMLHEAGSGHPGIVALDGLGVAVPARCPAAI